MDRTTEFFHLTSIVHQGTITRSSEVGPRVQCRGHSLLLVKAGELFSQIQCMEEFLRDIIEDYVGYHHILAPGASSEISKEVKKKNFQEITVFITSSGSDLNELRQSIRNHCITSTSTSRLHHTEIIQFLAMSLGRITERTRYMQQESEKINANPFKLISSGYGGSSSGGSYSGSGTLSIASEQTNLSSLPISSIPPPPNSVTNNAVEPVSSGLSTSAANFVPNPATALSTNFANRYGDEVAPVKKLREYERLASKHKAALFKETKDLRAKFSEEYNDTMKMEETVGLISNLLGDFVRILQSQEVFVEEVASHGKSATDQVEQAEEELIKTIQRSATSQRNMAIVTVGLALFLLLLDFLTA